MGNSASSCGSLRRTSGRSPTPQRGGASASQGGHIVKPTGARRTWSVMYRDPSGEQRWEGKFKTRGAAQRRLTEVLGEIDSAHKWEWHVGPPKSRKSQRRIAATESVMKMLADLKAGRPGSAFCFRVTAPASSAPTSSTPRSGYGHLFPGRGREASGRYEKSMPEARNKSEADVSITTLSIDITFGRW